MKKFEVVIKVITLLVIILNISITSNTEAVEGWIMSLLLYLMWVMEGL